MSGKLFELELTGMAYGGSAVGRHEGRAIFVPYVLPGERIRARIKQDKKRFALAEAVKLLGVAADRVEPRCPHFGPGLCGGCHWQHIAYPAQLLFKQQIVADQLRRIGGLAEVVVQPTIPSPDPWNYRSHVTFQTTPAGRLGFVREDNAAVLALRECHLIRPELLDLFNQHNRNVPENTARLRFQVGTDGAEHLAAITTPDEQMFGPVSANTMVHYTIREHTFQVTAGSFFQVNLPQAETLVNLVLDRLGLTGTERVLDLYSGVGLFTAFLAEQAAQVTAVESYPPAITDAEQNLAAFTNVELVEGAVETVLAALEGDYAAAVLDPPRAGVDAQALAALIKLAPQTIIYVSCDPSTLARDVKMLTQNGYEVLEVQPVDMFPQTYHIETVCWLKKNS
ncbi:MAG TPA: class I SAM-dependent RNA methyltransferase [Phototrophicaceae bacterium]|nr:class I SAM-dependent RNA methyltransferase [Phototrophicaceae bacterium]